MFGVSPRVDHGHDQAQARQRRACAASRRVVPGHTRHGHRSAQLDGPEGVDHVVKAPRCMLRVDHQPVKADMGHGLAATGEQSESQEPTAASPLRNLSVTGLVLNVVLPKPAIEQTFLMVIDDWRTLTYSPFDLGAMAVCTYKSISNIAGQILRFRRTIRPAICKHCGETLIQSK